MAAKQNWVTGDTVDAAAMNALGVEINSKASKSALFFSVKDYGAAGNGSTNDTAAFHTARDAAGVGGIVFVPLGTYIVNGAALNLAHQTWIFAPGAHLKLPNGATDGKIFTVTADYVTIDGGEWDGNRTNVTTPIYDSAIIITGTHCTVRNARVHDCDGWGILAFPATTTSTIDGTVVENCILTDCVSGGVMFDCITYNAVTVSSSNLRISGCYASIPSATPIAFWGGFNMTGSTTNRVLGAVIENCYVYKPVGTYTGCGGIFWRYVSGMQCANNYVSGTDLAYTFDDSEDSCLTGCTAFGWGLFGVEIGGTLTRTAISGCTLDGNGVSQVGIGCDNATNNEVTITGCTIGNMSKTSGGKGISVQTGGRGWTITGNNIRTPSIGIEIYNVSLTNLTLATNTFEMDSGGSQGFYCGIYLDPITTGARGWVVKDNNLIGWSNYGIRIEHGSALTASNITVQQNVYTNTGATLSLNNVTLDSTCDTGSTIELGGTTDTTLSRSAAGQLAVEGVDVLTTSNTKTSTNKTFTDPKINAIKDTNGSAALLLNPNASAVNYLQVDNGATGTGPALSPAGSDSAISLNLYPKGAANITLNDGNGHPVLITDNVASAVNYLRPKNAATGNAPALGAAGSDTNVALNLTSQGTELVRANSLPVLAEQLITLTSTYTLASQTAAQKLFNASTNGAVTLPIGVHFFECFFDLSSMSASSGAFGWDLTAGTATIAGIKWWSTANKAALATAASAQETVNTAANTAIVTATTNTVGWAKVTGKVRISAGGTVIPKVSLGVAAAAVVSVDSYFRIWQVSNSATATTVGNWS